MMLKDVTWSKNVKEKKWFKKDTSHNKKTHHDHCDQKVTAVEIYCPTKRE